jgi:hypothetical protein
MNPCSQCNRQQGCGCWPKSVYEKAREAEMERLRQWSERIRRTGK